MSIFVTTLLTANSTESDSNPNLPGSTVTPEVSVEYLPTSSIIFSLISSKSVEKLSTASLSTSTFSFNTLTTELNARSKALPSTTTPDSSAAAAKEFTVAINLLLLC